GQGLGLRLQTMKMTLSQLTVPALAGALFAASLLLSIRSVPGAQADTGWRLQLLATLLLAMRWHAPGVVVGGCITAILAELGWPGVREPVGALAVNGALTLVTGL